MSSFVLKDGNTNIIYSVDDDGDTVETSFTSEEAKNRFFNEVSGANVYEEEYMGRTVIISTFVRNDYGN